MSFVRALIIIKNIPTIITNMNIRKIVDRLIVLLVLAFSLASAEFWISRQYYEVSTISNVLPGGSNIDTLVWIIMALSYQLLIAADYPKKHRDSLVIVLILGLLLTISNQRLGYNTIGVWLSTICLILLTLESIKYPYNTEH